MIAPWEVDALPEVWTLAAQEITRGAEKQARRQAEDARIAQKMAAWRSSHPAYRRQH